MTALCHGAEAAAAAEATARAVFEQGGVGDDLPTLTLAPADIPAGGISVVQLLVRAGLAGSGKDARRLIAEGGARLDDAALTDAGLHLDAAALAATPQAVRGPQAPRAGPPGRLSRPPFTMIAHRADYTAPRGCGCSHPHPLARSARDRR